MRQSSVAAEGLLQVAKWIKVQVLLDSSEMQALIEALDTPHFVCVSDPVCSDAAEISCASFLEIYRGYVDALKRGIPPQEESLRRTFSCALSKTLDVFYAVPLRDGRFLVKPRLPVVQMQAHHFFYSALDGKFHPMALSVESISWGLQFSYPQLYQDPKTKQVVKVSEEALFVNTPLFTSLMRWMRSHTMPTPFSVQGRRTNAPIRVGKKALEWVSAHPQLRAKGIEVAGSLPFLEK
jgi:hypothetical protein